MGITPKAWGPSAWRLLYAMADILDQRRIPYQAYFEQIRYVLPCIWCRVSYPIYYEAVQQYLARYPRAAQSARLVVRLLDLLVRTKLAEQDRGGTGEFDITGVLDWAMRNPQSMRAKLGGRPITADPWTDFLFYSVCDVKGDDDRRNRVMWWISAVLHLMYDSERPEIARKYDADLAALSRQDQIGTIRSRLTLIYGSIIPYVLVTVPTRRYSVKNQRVMSLEDDVGALDQD